MTYTRLKAIVLLSVLFGCETPQVPQENTHKIHFDFNKDPNNYAFGDLSNPSAGWVYLPINSSVGNYTIVRHDSILNIYSKKAFYRVTSHGYHTSDRSMEELEINDNNIIRWKLPEDNKGSFTFYFNEY